MGMKQSLDLSRTPDSELILHAYRKWGEACLTHLLGDFAFVIWDKPKQKLFCAKDRFGMRQLYYAQKDNSIIVCNALSVMLKHPNISKEHNERAIGGFLLFGDHTLLDRSATMNRNINILLPAHKLILYNGNLSIVKYWDIPVDIPLINYRKKSDYIENFLEVFMSAVKDRLRLDTITISMSGGMDSTSVAAIANQIGIRQKDSKLKLEAFTTVYDQIFKSVDERHYASIVANKLNIPIHYQIADNFPFFNTFSLTTRPLESYGQTYNLHFEKNAAMNARVLLTGAAADNLFAPSSKIISLRESKTVPFFFDQLMLKKIYGEKILSNWGIASFIHNNILRKKYTADTRIIPDWIHPDFRETLQLNSLIEEFYERMQSKIHPRHPNAYNLLQLPDWSADDLFTPQDFTFTEKRDPFLDVRLIKFLFSIPSNPWFINKHILRESMRLHLPKEIINRPKTNMGYMLTEIFSMTNPSILDTWTTTPILSNYIIKEKVPSFLSTKIDEESKYINLRAYILNDWLKTNS
jgi:asparagine synthase (glutamine-hydrolysing)